MTCFLYKKEPSEVVEGMPPIKILLGIYQRYEQTKEYLE